MIGAVCTELTPGRPRLRAGWPHRAGERLARGRGSRHKERQPGPFGL